VGCVKKEAVKHLNIVRSKPACRLLVAEIKREKIWISYYKAQENTLQKSDTAAVETTENQAESSNNHLNYSNLHSKVISSQSTELSWRDRILCVCHSVSLHER
jgi:hypothetical protein